MSKNNLLQHTKANFTKKFKNIKFIQTYPDGAKVQIFIVPEYLPGFAIRLEEFNQQNKN